MVCRKKMWQRLFTLIVAICCIGATSSNLLSIGVARSGGDNNLPSQKTQKEQSKKRNDKKNQHKRILNQGKTKYKGYDLTDQFRRYPKPHNKILLFDKQTELAYGGAVKTDYYVVRHATTLDKNQKDDAIDQFRQRSELALAVSHKMDQFRDHPVVEGRVTLGNTMFWRTLYQPRNVLAAAAASEFDLVFPPVQVHMQEAWLKLNVDQLFSNNEPAAMGIKLGFFPFFVGRGITLGDWYNGGSYIYGFSNTAVQMQSPKFPPGALMSGNIIKNTLDYDIYFSPSVGEDIRNDNIGFTHKDSPLTTLSQRHIIAARLRSTFDIMDKSKLYVEPYFVYYNSPRHGNRSTFDSQLKVLTPGVMLDFKGAGFEINFEAARQFGNMSIKEKLNSNRPNRERFLVRDNATGKVSYPIPSGKNLAHHLRPASSDDPAIVSTALKSDGTASGSQTSGFHYVPVSYDQWAASTSPGSNFKDTDQTRYFEYHPAREVDLAGRMVVCDIRYTFDEAPVQIAASFGYFSGDEYPFNDDSDKFFVDQNVNPSLSPAKKSYKHFLPFREYYYTGLWAFPMVMMNAGLVPRPYNMSYRDLNTLNEQACPTNLIYIAAGFSISPINNLEEFRINPNVCSYWTDHAGPMWEIGKDQPNMVKVEEDNAEKASRVSSETNQKKVYKRLNGWESVKKGGTHLGWELNCLANYKITNNLDLMVKGGVFFPGQVYKDAAGQPNETTQKLIKEVQPNGSFFEYNENKGLGTDTAYGFNIRLAYIF